MFIRELQFHSATLSLFRAEELETALMEMVKQDNRRQLHARVLNSENFYTLQFFFPHISSFLTMDLHLSRVVLI